jgi:uncharacterized membrane protein
MKRILSYFLRGLLVTVPVGLTILLLVYVFRGLDKVFGGLFRIPTVPGLGLFLGIVVTLGAITLIGFLASSFIGRRLFWLVDRVFTRVPLVKMLYTSIRYLVEAFAGEKKRFDKPVLVTLGPGSSAKAVGFITRESLECLGLKDHVAVYLPQSYNFAGNVLVFPKEAVRPLDIESSEAMAFIVSGGVSGSTSGK